MSEATNEAPPAAAKKRPAKKSATAPAPAKKAAAKKRKTAKPRTAKVKNFLYEVLDTNGKSKGPPSGNNYTSINAMLEDISLAAAPAETVVIYREVKRGTLKTKVRLG